MPETRVEWVLFVLALVAIALFAFVTARDWHRTHAVAAQVHVPRATTQLPTASRTSVPTATTRAPPNTTAVSTMARAAVRTGVTLTVAAARGDSWIEVRNGSLTGVVVYAGTLTSGSAKTFRAQELFVRFGQAGDIDATIDGHSQRLPGGTYTARVDSRGYAFVHS